MVFLYQILDQPLVLISGLTADRGRDHMAVGFITTYAISAYHH